jgi:hypothetical protein
VTVRRMRGASLGVAGALAAGLVIAPAGGATAAGSDDPVFYSIPATPATSSADIAGRLRAQATSARATGDTAAISKGLQALQVLPGANQVGNTGLTVAAGPKHVVQVGDNSVRMLTKNTGGVAKAIQLGQLFGLTGVNVSQGTIVYDPLGKRFVAAAVTDDGGQIGLALRVTQGTNPVKLTKWQPTVTFASNDTGNADAVELDPMIGTSNDKIIITTPITDSDEPANANRIFIFPKAPIYSGNAPDPWTADLNNTWDGQAPAVNRSKQNNIFVGVPATNDVTLTQYTGAATTAEPNYTKSVTYPSTPLTAPPVVDQAGGDDLDLGPLAFSGAAWRSGEFFATATGTCAGNACVRLIGLGTDAGVYLIEDEKLKATTGAALDLFSPSVDIDGAGYVHVAATAVQPDGLGPSLAAFALTKVSLADTAGSDDLKARVIALGDEAFDDNGTPGTTDWYGSTGAAADPTSPWDVWVTGPAGSSAIINPNLTSSVARMSMAKNAATIKASDTTVTKGTKVKFTLKLKRPDSGDSFKGMPITLQRKGGGKWKKIDNGTTSKKGVYKTTKTVKNTGKYRTLGKAVNQVGGQGVAIEKVVSKQITITVT